MASLMTSAIVALCVSSPAMYQSACNSAVDAGTRQVGLRQDVDSFEEKTVSVAKSKTEAALGDQKWFLGAALFSAKVAKEKKVDFKVPDIGVADSIKGTVAPKSYGMVFEWKF